MNRYLVELPIVDATTSPKKALERMRESGRSGLVYFVKGAPYVVHSKDVMRGMMRGQETITRVHHVQIGRQKEVPQRRVRAFRQPRAAIVRINEEMTSAQIIVGSEAKRRWLGGPPMMCQCRGRYGHEAAHGEHGPRCRRDDAPFDCAPY